MGVYRFMGSEKLFRQAIARPVNYISYQTKALDGKGHDVAIYFEMDSHKAFCAGQSTQMYEKNGLVLMKTGRENQKLWVNKGKKYPAWGRSEWVPIS